MSKTLDVIRAKPWVHAVDDERALGNAIVVTLKTGYQFSNEPGCGVQGFDTVADARSGTTAQAVQQMTADAE